VAAIKLAKMVRKAQRYIQITEKVTIFEVLRCMYRMIDIEDNLR